MGRCGGHGGNVFNLLKDYKFKFENPLTMFFISMQRADAAAAAAAVFDMSSLCARSNHKYACVCKTHMAGAR